MLVSLVFIDRLVLWCSLVMSWCVAVLIRLYDFVIGLVLMSRIAIFLSSSCVFGLVSSMVLLILFVFVRVWNAVRLMGLENIGSMSNGR